MPSLATFLSTISRYLPAPPARVEDAISKLNPDKIYLENVRSALGVSTEQARRICETAVRQGLFRQAVEVACPDGSVAASASRESDLPETVRCWTGEGEHIEEVQLATADLKKTLFYQLV